MLEKPALKLFGKLVIRYADAFDSLQIHMKRASITTSVVEYVSVTLLLSFFTFAASLIVLTVLVGLLIPHLSYAYTFALLISVLVGGMVFALGYLYPSLKAKGTSGKIDKSLPFATFYMATTASSGTQPVNIFKMLSIRGGPIGEEASRIYTSVQAMGMDLPTALDKAAARTPSATFAELLYGMISVLTTGGDLEEYLKSRTRTSMATYRRKLEDYAKSIALYTEIYITLIIVGTIFFIILLAIIAPLIGGNTLFMQAFLVFFFIPLISIGFIMLLKGASPVE